MKHLSGETLSAHLDRALSGRAAEQAGRHLAACEMCRAALAELAAQDDALRPALSHDPGEAYFESFSARVEERIRATATVAARSRGQGPDLGRFFRSPRTLVWVGGAATVVAGVGIALMSGREVRPPDLRDRELAARIEQTAPRELKEAAGKKATPPPASREQAGPPSAQPGTTGRADENVVATPVAPLAQSAPGDARVAGPGRALEVRRNEMGEDVPVRKAGGRLFLAPPPPTAVSGSGDETQIRKRLLAEPLERSKSSATTQSLDAAGPKSESGPGEYSYASPPAGAANTATTRLLGNVRGAEGEGRLCGEVRDAAGRPVAGAQVVVTDLGRATTTDAHGGFCVGVPRGEHPLSVMAVGFAESRQTVQVGADPVAVRVTLAVVPVLEDKRATTAGRVPLPRVTVAPPAERQDSYSVLPDTLRSVVRAVQDFEANARSRHSASLYDVAAAGWGRALRRLTEGPLEMETRWHLAETRFLAWESGPNGRRASAAVEALTAYTLRAPAGAERDQAARWLDQVRR